MSSPSGAFLGDGSRQAVRIKRGRAVARPRAFGTGPGDACEAMALTRERLDAPFEEVVDRPPVDARRLHRDMRAPGGSEPVREPQQLPGGGSERPHLLAALRAIARGPETGRDARLCTSRPQQTA
jgi:hypothetical protein